MEDQKLTVNTLSGSVSWVSKNLLALNFSLRLTPVLREELLRPPVYSEPDCPSRQITQYYRSQTSVQSPQTLFPPYNSTGPNQALIYHIRSRFVHPKSPLCLQLRLYHIQRTGDNPGRKPSCRPGQSSKAVIRSGQSPCLYRTDRQILSLESRGRLCKLLSGRRRRGSKFVGSRRGPRAPFMRHLNCMMTASISLAPKSSAGVRPPAGRRSPNIKKQARCVVAGVLQYRVPVCGEFNPTAPPVTLQLTVVDCH
jgi:hypothetical protein